MDFLGCKRRVRERGGQLAVRASARLLEGALGVAFLVLAALSHAGALSPRRLVEVADLSSPVISPDGTHVAFRLEQASIERNRYDCFWYVQSMDGTSPPIRVADGGTVLRNSAGEPLAASVTWSPDSRWIYFVASLQGRVDVWRAAADGSSAEAVTHDPADVREFSLEQNGRILKYRVGATREQVLGAELDEYDRGIHIDDSVPIGQGLFRSGSVDGRLATQRLGAWFDRVPLLADAPSHWKSVDVASGATRDMAPSEIPPAAPGVSALSGALAQAWKLEKDPVGKHVALLTRVGDGTGLLEKPDVQLSVLADMHSREQVVCTSAPCTGKAITSVQWRPGSDEVLYTVTDPAEGLAQSIFGWNVRTGDVHEIAHSRGLLNGGRSRSSTCGLSSDVLVCVAADAGRPPRLVKITLSTGAQQLLFDPNAALAQDMAKDMPVQLLRWRDKQGREFTGQFYPARRPGGGPGPLFITYYLCPGFVRGGVGDEWPLVSLAERGVSALCINAAPYRLDATERYGAGLSAIESIVRQLVSEGKVDRSRVGMGGLSFGTEMTLWTMMHSNLLAAASISSPGISRQYYLIGSMRGTAFFSGLRKFWQAGAPDETPERWRQLSPDLNLDKLRVPMLMQLPEQEYIHTLDFAVPLIRERLADLYVFPNEPHQKFQPRHKLAAYERNLDWFLFWLMDYENPDPAKATQYAHWRSMKARAGTGPGR
jgi:dipeptidyl aminopeptidase/acylaminoacyl peptidase